MRNTVAKLETKTLEQQRFIHILSHDLRKPINAIVNFSSLLAQDNAAGLPEAGRRYLNFVHSGGERMKTLLDGFEVAERASPLLRDKRKVVLVTLTSSSSPDDRRRAAELDIIHGFITRPLTDDSVKGLLGKSV